MKNDQQINNEHAENKFFTPPKSQYDKSSSNSIFLKTNQCRLSKNNVSKQEMIEKWSATMRKSFFHATVFWRKQRLNDAQNGGKHSVWEKKSFKPSHSQRGKTSIFHRALCQAQHTPRPSLWSPNIWHEALLGPKMRAAAAGLLRQPILEISAETQRKPHKVLFFALGRPFAKFQRNSQKQRRPAGSNTKIPAVMTARTAK